MRYCPNCLAEYEDAAKTCADCVDQALVSEEEIAKRPEFRRVRDGEDTTQFVAVGTAEDPFDADAFTDAIHDAGIPVLTVMRRSSAVDALTTTVQRAWWELRVPAEHRQRAAEALEVRRKELEAVEVDAEQAAVEEELQTEQGAMPPSEPV